jgi:hypothetical protein
VWKVLVQMALVQKDVIVADDVGADGVSVSEQWRKSEKKKS